MLVAYGDVSSLIGASLQSPINEADLLSIAIFTDGAAGARLPPFFTLFPPFSALLPQPS